MHLTREQLDRLLHGLADRAEAQALAAHLDTDCTACEAFLASLAPSELDGLADRGLSALTPPQAAESGNDLEFARIQRTLRASGRRPFATRWAPVAAAAAVVLLVGAGLRAGLASRSPTSWDGAKGSETSDAAPVRLSAVAVLETPGHAPRIWKVARGEVVPCEASLQLQVELRRAAEVTLVRTGGAGEAVDTFWQARGTAAGPLPITVGGKPAGYPLEGLKGPQRFLVLASQQRLSPERIAVAARALAAPSMPGSARAALAGLSVDMVEVTVDEASER